MGWRLPARLAVLMNLSDTSAITLETPHEAKRNMISGDVTLEFTFEKDGSPTRISVLVFGFWLRSSSQAPD